MQVHATVTNPTGVVAVVLAVRSGWWGEKHPGLTRVGGGVGNAHVLRRVGFALPEASVALALGGNALAGAVKIGIGDGGQFHSVFNKKARAGRAGENLAGLG